MVEPTADVVVDVLMAGGVAVNRQILYEVNKWLPVDSLLRDLERTVGMGTLSSADSSEGLIKGSGFRVVPGSYVYSVSAASAPAAQLGTAEGKTTFWDLTHLINLMGLLAKLVRSPKHGAPCSGWSTERQWLLAHGTNKHHVE